MVSLQMQNIRCMWETYVKVAGVCNMNRPININAGLGINCDADKMNEDDIRAVQVIMKLYSLETFLYKEVNKASREKDERKIKTLGPYAYLVAKILQRLNPTINVGKDYIF